MLNAGNARAAAAAARTMARVFWFSIEAFGSAGRMGGGWLDRISRRARGRASRADCAAEPDSAQGRAQRRECTRRSLCARLAGRMLRLWRSAASKIFKAVEHRLEFVAIDNGVEYLQRLQGHERRCCGQGHCGFSRRHSSDPGRQGQELQLCAICPICCADALRPFTPSAPRRQRSRSQIRGMVPIVSCETLDQAVAAARAGRASGRCGAAVAGVLQLRPV